MPQFRIDLKMERRLLLVLGRFCLTTRGLVSACQHQIGTWCLSSTHARSRPTGAPPSLSVPDLGLGHQPRLESSQGRSNAADRVCAAATTLLCIACSSTLQCAAAVERATPETGRCAFKEVRACKWATPSSRLLAVSPKRGNCQRLSFSFLLRFWSELGMFIFEHYDWVAFEIFTTFK